MKPFTIERRGDRIAHIYDNRYTSHVDITDGKGNFGRFHYTLRDEDVRQLEKPVFQPYAQHIGLPRVQEDLGDNIRLEAPIEGVSCRITSKKDGLFLMWKYRNTGFSAFSASLTLNYMSQKNGSWENQLLVSSPCYDRRNRRLFCLFTRPDGNHLALIVTTPTEGFRIGYSEHLCGHFFTDFEIVANPDRVYGAAPLDEAKIAARLIPVNSYEAALEAASRVWKLPAAIYALSSCFIGETRNIRIIGEHDSLHVYDPEGIETVYPPTNHFQLKAEKYGPYRVVPCFVGREGIECVCFAHTNWMTMYRRSILSVPVQKKLTYACTGDGTAVWLPPAATYRGCVDTNLCEHTMWAWSLLRYRHHEPIGAEQEDSLCNLLRIITAKDEVVFRPSQTIVDEAQNACGLGPYNTFRSDRIQETFNGVNILLDFWRAYRDSNLLERAVTVLSAQMNQYFYGGCIRRNDGTDYTTVTAMVLPVVDLFRELTEQGDARSKRFAEYAEAMADYVVARNLDFPTEGGTSADFDREMEEGSMACSALTTLYVARYVKNKPEYLRYAETIMRFHDAWCIYTPNAPMFHSSLRWWETLWEGDADGPALCCGHAWSIWRGEAEFWLGLLTHSGVRLLGSYNTYLSNFSKEDEAGNMYSIYQCEPMISGAWESDGEKISRRYAVGFPEKKDVTLSRYVFARAADTWFRCTALLEQDGEDLLINGEWRNGELVSKAPFFGMLYIGNMPQELTVRTEQAIEIFCAAPIDVTEGAGIRVTPWGFLVAPDRTGRIILRISRKRMPRWSPQLATRAVGDDDVDDRL